MPLTQAWAVYSDSCFLLPTILPFWPSTHFSSLTVPPCLPPYLVFLNTPPRPALVLMAPIPEATLAPKRVDQFKLIATQRVD
jgi:hypothetical protein